MTATITNKGDKVAKVKVRFDEKIVTHLSLDSSLAQNDSVANENPSSPSNENLISIDLNDDSYNTFNNEYDGNSINNDMIISEPESVKITRIGRRIHALSKYSNRAMLLFRLFISQYVSEMNLNIDRYKQISFFKAQLDYISEINKLSDESNNAFLPMAL